MNQPVVIVGASVAGSKTAQLLRAKGFAGRLVVLTGDDRWPHDRPPLSKGFLVGSADEDSVRLLPPAWLAENDVELLVGDPAVGLDAAGRTVTTRSGRRIAFSHLVIATGASAMSPLMLQGAGGLTLRSLDDAVRLRGTLVEGSRLAILGGGLIGAEVACAARHLGVEVTVVEAQPRMLSRVLGPGLSVEVEQTLERLGVRVQVGLTVTGCVEQAGSRLLATDDGLTVAADTVLVSVGSRPSTGWLEGSGLGVEDGVKVDERGRVLGSDSVWAVGDVARFWHPDRSEYVRLENWTHAVSHAGCVAHNIATPDDQVEYAPVPYFWSDLQGARLQGVGWPSGAAATELLRARSANAAAELHADSAGALAGVVTLNAPRLLPQLRRLVSERATLAEAVSRLQELLDSLPADHSSSSVPTAR